MATKTKTEQAQHEPLHGVASAAAKANPSGYPFFGLQRTLGNQAMLRLFESGGVQTKLRISQPGDADEQEADRAAEQIVSRKSYSSTPVLQRKCACGGTCSSCKGEEEQEQVIHRSALGPLRAFPFSIQRAAAEEPSHKAAAAGEDARQDQAKHPGERPHMVVVEDDAPSLAPGQMRKTEFLNLLQSSTCATADAVLEAVGHSTKGCPYIRKWLAHYKGTDAQHLTRAMHKYAPETLRARSAHEAIALVNHRVQRAALSWAKTGKVSDLPEEIQEEMAGGGGGGFLGAVGKFAHSGFGSALLGFVGGGKQESGAGAKAEKGIQRKSRDGAAAAAHDVSAVKEQLGSGHSLDGRVQSQMSSAFGYDFSGVRVHTDSKAGELSGQLQARAFTIGSDVAFAGGEYKPGTLVGDALIAHELAHVVQQGGGKQAVTALTKDASLSDDSSLEQDADRSAVGAVVSAWTGVKKGLAEIRASALPRLKSGLRLQRCEAIGKFLGLTSDKDAGTKTSPDAGKEAKDDSKADQKSNEPEQTKADQFRDQLGAIPEQKAAIAALFSNKTFLSLWNYLKNCPALPKKDLGPLGLKVTPGLKIRDKERYGGYSPVSRTLEINPTKPEHKANPAELVDTITHELIHAVFDLAPDCVAAGAGAPPLAGGATLDVPSRQAVAGTEKEKRLMVDPGPGASDPCGEFIDINAAAQQMVIQIIRENIKMEKVGRPTIVFVNEILRRNPAAMQAYKACRDLACAKSKLEDRQTEMAKCSADIITRFMPPDLSP